MTHFQKSFMTVLGLNHNRTQFPTFIDRRISNVVLAKSRNNREADVLPSNSIGDDVLCFRTFKYSLKFAMANSFRLRLCRHMSSLAQV